MVISGWKMLKKEFLKKLINIPYFCEHYLPSGKSENCLPIFLIRSIPKTHFTCGIIFTQMIIFSQPWQKFWVNLHKLCKLHKSWSMREPCLSSMQTANHIYTFFTFSTLYLCAISIVFWDVERALIPSGWNDCLLKIIKDTLPIGPNDKDQVTACHCMFYPGCGWMHDSLKHKFSFLYNHKMPMDDPTCPVYVQTWSKSLNSSK